MIPGIKKTAMTAIASIWLCTSPPASAQFFGSDAAFLIEIISVLGTILTESQRVSQATETIIEGGDFGELAPLLDDIENFQVILAEAQHLAFTADRVLDDFETIFPQDFEEFDLFQTIAALQDVNATSREAVERLLQVGATVSDSQVPTAARVENLTRVGASGTPAASLQAIAQLGAEQIGQIQQLQNILVTQSRVLGLEAAERETARKRAKRLRELDDPTSFIVEEPADVLFGSAID